MFTKMKKYKKLNKGISIVLLVFFVLNITSLPTLAVEGIKMYNEQQAWKEILNADLQTDLTDGKNKSADSDAVSQAADKEKDKTGEQRKAEYQKKLQEDAAAYESSRFIIKYKDGSSIPQFDSAKSQDIKSVNKVNNKENKKFAVVETTEPMKKTDFVGVMQTAKMDSNIEYIQPDYEMTVSSDPMLAEQWGHGDSSPDTPVTIGADVMEAWGVSQGDGVIVAVLDTGIDTSHTDLANNIYTNNNEIAGNGIDDDGNGYVDDSSGWDFFNDDNTVNDTESYYDQWHGTHVAGIIAAQKDNGIGIAGVAPKAKILPIKIFEGGHAYTSDIIDAIAYADSMGAKIVNCSWGSRYENPALEEAIANSDALFVCATGNNLYNTDIYPVYPAAYSPKLANVISVASIDATGKLSRFSNYGANSVDISAPGENIVSTWLDGEYRSNNGTSMSAAYVSGAAALVYAKGTFTTAMLVKARLISSADTVTGLEDKIIDGKKLNCSYAVSDNSLDNESIFNIPDAAALPVIIPDTEPSADDYQQFGAENYVTYKSAMGTARHGLQVVTLNGKIYAIGGQTADTSGYTNIMEVYDPETDTWSTAASMNYSRSYFGAVVYDGKIYVMGGRFDSYGYRDSVEIYNPATNTWTVMYQPMPVSMSAFSTTLIPGTSKVYAVGGCNGAYRNSVYEYDIAANTWTTKPSLSIPISQQVAFYYDGKIYVEGGVTTGGSYTYDEYQYDIVAGTTADAVGARSSLADAAGVLTCDRFISIGGQNASSQYSTDITNSWLLQENENETGYYIYASHMSTARAGLGVVLLEGKVYMVGGKNSAGALSSVEVLDLGWQEKADLPEPMFNYKSVELDGKIYIMGGLKYVDEDDLRTKSVYMYDTSNNTWVEKNDMPVYAQYFTVTAAYGKIYLFGGETTPNDTGYYYASDKIYEYDPQTDSWTIKNTLSQARDRASSVLYNGKIYITGGYYDASGLDTVETYDPLTNLVAQKNDLPIEIYDHFSCVLNDQLYIFDSDNHCLLYNEATDSWNTLTPEGNLYGGLFVVINDSLYALQNSNFACPETSKYLTVDNLWTYYYTFNFYGYMDQGVEANNKVYIFTCDTGSMYSTHLIEYTPPVSSWVRKPAMPSDCYGIGTTTAGDKIYTVGGYDDSTYLDSLFVYDEAENSWTTLSSMTYARSRLGLAAANGKLYAIGGKNESSNALRYVEEYNPSTNAWATKTLLSSTYAVSDMAIASYNNKIYLFGGRDSSGAAQSRVLEYNPATDTWTTKVAMNTARYGCGAAVIGDQIYVAGGFTGANDTSPTNVLAVYDPVNNTWDNTKAAMPVALGYSGVVAADSLYVIDGYNGYSESSLVYEYSPVLDRWFSWAGPNHVRYSFGAAITDQGIYVIGGRNASSYFNEMEFTTINSLKTDYLHLGEDEINLSGNFSRTYTDMSYTAPGFNINFSRTYNSKDDRTTDTIISRGWTFGFQGKIDSSGNDVIVRLPNGSGNTFRLNANGSYTAQDSRNTLVKQVDNTYILTTKDQYTYGFNSSGYLIWMKDRNGNAINITVNGSGQVTAVTDQAGNVTNITYSSNRISTITDPAGRVVYYYYDANGRLSQVTDTMGYSTHYTYNTAGYLSSVKDTNNNYIEQITYRESQNDEIPRVGTVTDLYGNVTTYAYDDSTGLLSAVDSNGRTNLTWYDRMLYPVRTRDAEGRETRTQYRQDGGLNRYGEIVAFTDRSGNTTNYDLDPNGNVLRQINPDDSIKEFTYDSKNNLLSEKDELGKYKFYVYDGNDINLVKVAQPLNGTDVYSSGATQSNFAITTYDYYTGAEALGSFGKTIYGLLKNSTNPEGGVTHYTYDVNGNIATMVNPTLKTTTYQYNKLGWLKTVTTSEGYSTNSFYDKNGRLLKEIKPNPVMNDIPTNSTTRYVYDFRGNVTQKIMPTQYAAAADTTATFNAENMQSSASTTYTQTGHGYRYTYDTAGSLTALSDPLNNTAQYTSYDLYGNNLTEIEPNGAIYTYEYDVMNRISKKSFQESEVATPIVLEEYGYSVLGDGSTSMSLTQHFDAASSATVTLTYDYAGRQIRLDQADGTHTTNYYNANGTLAASTDARGNTTYYAYDGLNRLSGKWVPDRNSLYDYTGMEYDKAGRLLTQSQSTDAVTNGNIPATGLISTSYVYNADGTVQEKSSSSGAKIEYEYDDDGNVVSEDVYYDANTYKHYEYTYHYLHKLKTKTEVVKNQDISGYDNTPTALNLTTSYTYDANGNVLTVTDPNGTTVTNTYDEMNRQLSASQPGVDENNTAVTITTSATYDWAGNVLTTTDALMHVTEYTYNERGFLSKISDPLDGVQYYEYDWAGRKLAEVSPNNYSETALSSLNRTEYVYDNMGRVLQVKQIYRDPNDNNNWKTVVAKDYTYDNNGNLIKAKDALGYQGNYDTEYVYDEANRLKQELDPESKVLNLAYSKKYEYDALGRLITKTAVQDASHEIATAYTYNDDGKVLTVTVGSTLMQSNTYDWQGNLLSQTDGEGNVTAYTYNDLNLVRSVTAPGDDTVDSYTVNYRYTVLGLMAEQSDSMGKQIINAYDRQGHLLAATEQKSDASEAITASCRYDKNGNLRYQTDGNGNVSQYTYDDLNRPVTKTVSVTDINSVTTQQTTTYAYDANGNKLSEENWRGNSYTYTYDPLNRLIEKRDPNDTLIEKLVYNNNGAQIYSTDALDQTTEYVYDRNGRLVETIDALDHSQEQAYDVAGNIIRKVDANTNETTYAYDAFNRLLTVTNALAETTSYTYDHNGNMLTQTDGKGNVTTMAYNCRNLLTALIENDGVTMESYSYNADGTVAGKLDRNGVTTAYAYDIHGRVLSQDAGGAEISYTYDNNGNQLTMTDGTGTTTREYDELGRVIQKTVPAIGTSTYLYDVTAGVPSYYVGETTTDPKGNITTQVFDRAGRLYQVKAGSDTTTYTYYANGNRHTLTYPNGLVAEYTYYADNRLHTLANKNGAIILEAFNYAYDANGNLASKLDGKGTTSYTYDALNRLASVTEPNSKVTEYTFDAAGNRTSEAVTVNSVETLTNYTYDAQNRLTSTDEMLSGGGKQVTEYHYDANGNMTGKQAATVTPYDAGHVTSIGISVVGEDAASDGTALYQYDTYNRMTTVYEGDYVTQNTYNGDGLRVQKAVTQAGETATTQYLYDYDKVVLELDGNGSQTARNVYGNDTLISRTAESVTLYYLYNGHGDVTALTNGSGTVVASYYYDAFGEVVEEAGTSAGDNPYRYAGYTYDTESELYYLQARYYAPKIARFMSEDTYMGSSADPLSLNLYTYCFNNPLVYWDPTGYSPTMEETIKELEDAINSGNTGAIDDILQEHVDAYGDGESGGDNGMPSDVGIPNYWGEPSGGDNGMPSNVGIPNDWGEPGSASWWSGQDRDAVNEYIANIAAVPELAELFVRGNVSTPAASPTVLSAGAAVVRTNPMTLLSLKNSNEINPIVGSLRNGSMIKASALQGFGDLAQVQLDSNLTSVTLIVNNIWVQVPCKMQNGELMLNTEAVFGALSHLLDGGNTEFDPLWNDRPAWVGGVVLAVASAGATVAIAGAAAGGLIIAQAATSGAAVEGLLGWAHAWDAYEAQHGIDVGIWKASWQGAKASAGKGALDGVILSPLAAAPYARAIGGAGKSSVNITNDILGKPRTGKALKLDDYHAFNDIVDNYAGAATKTGLNNGANLYQIEGSLNGVFGRFEWITQNGNVTHRMFVPGGIVNGVPIKP